MERFEKSEFSHFRIVQVSEISVTISKVAVIGKESTLCDGSVDDGQDLAELVEGELLGIYGVVERKHLEEILDEQRLTMSGLLLEVLLCSSRMFSRCTRTGNYGCLQRSEYFKSN